MVRALERARRWIGTLSPPDVAGQLEDDSLRIWKNGDAAFMRNWPYAYVESMRPDSSVKNRLGVTLLPKGDQAGARHADVLGGFQLMVSKKSANKDAAIELVKFLTSPEIQRTGIKGQSVFRDFAGRAFERSSDTTLHGHRDI